MITHKGGKTKSEFSAAESEPSWEHIGPDDAEIGWEGVNEVNKVDDLMTDTSKLEEFATGKPLSAKKKLIAEKKNKRLQNLQEDTMEQAEYLENKYGPGPEPDDLIEGIDFASGGRVPFFKGKIAKGLASLGKKKKTKVKEEYYSK